MRITEGYSRGRIDDLETDEFMDLCDFVWSYGSFEGVNAIPDSELENLTLIKECIDQPDALRLYIREGYPYAVYETDLGFTVVK